MSVKLTKELIIDCFDEDGFFWKKEKVQFFDLDGNALTPIDRLEFMPGYINDNNNQYFKVHYIEIDYDNLEPYMLFTVEEYNENSKN